jgi:APA family basic amino acid/polyamine antiporter
MIYGIARDACLPKVFCRISTRTLTPHIAVFAVMLVSIAFVMIGDIALIAKLTTASIFIAYIFVNLSLIALRYKSPGLERKFKAPLNIGKLPLVGILGLATSAVLLFYTDTLVLVLEAVLIVLGFAIYTLFVRKN